MNSISRALAAATALVCIVVACSTGNGASPQTSGSGETNAGGTARSGDAGQDVSTLGLAGAVPSDSNDDYAFSRVAMTAGGWVTGIVAHPSQPDVMYARTDVGGAYRWNPTTREWEQMITASSVADRDAGGDLYQVESMAVAASDADVVYLSVGDDEPIDETTYETNGRVLRSADGGRSWTSSSARFFIAGNGDFRQQGERIAVDPARSDVVILGTRRQGIWISADGGDTFDASGMTSRITLRSDQRPAERLRRNRSG